MNISDDMFLANEGENAILTLGASTFLTFSAFAVPYLDGVGSTWS